MKIVAAAIEIKGSIVSGVMIHACLWSLAFEEGLMPKKSERQMTVDDWGVVWCQWESQEGFLLDNGAFVNREEAAEIALGNGQADETYRPQELHVPDIYFG